MARTPFHRPPDADVKASHVGHPSVPCARCGCAVFHYENRSFVRVVDLGASIATPDEPEPAHRDMGYQSICNVCVKYIPERFHCNCQDARGGF